METAAPEIIRLADSPRHLAALTIRILLLMVITGLFSKVSANQCRGFTCTLTGTDGDDYLVGTAQDDVICGLRGQDIILGLAGNDMICGGPGNDVLKGNEGMDILQGGSGRDTLYGGPDQDELNGNQGNDLLLGEDGNDFLTGGQGKDSLDGGAGEDYCDADRQDTLKQCIKIQDGINTTTSVFSIQGNRIIDPDGNPFVPKGVNIFPWHQSPANIESIKNCWNFNLVRLHAWILPQAESEWKDHLVYIDEPLLFDAQTIDKDTYDVRSLIELYTSQKIVVIFDVHEYIGKFLEGAALEQYLIFITDFAEKFRDNPYVWLDIHNEPGSYEGQTGDFAKWRYEVDAILTKVKSIAPNMVTLVSGVAWGQDSGPYWGSRNVEPGQSALLSNADLFQQYDNVIATFHVYDQWTFGTDRLENFLDQLYTTLSVPVIVGEYGAFNNVSTLSASESLHTAIRQYSYERTGRIVWTWDANDTNDLTDSTTGGGRHIDSCTSPGNLTPLGRMVWDDTHR